VGVRDWFDQWRGHPPAQRSRRPRQDGRGRSGGRRSDQATQLIEGRPAPRPGPVLPPRPVEGGYTAPGARGSSESTRPRPIDVRPPQPLPSVGPVAVEPPAYHPPQPLASHAPGVRPGAFEAAPTVIHTAHQVQDQIVGVLVCMSGELQGELYALRDGESRLGRDPRCEVRFSERDKRISRSHAEILHRQGHFAIRPLSDANPTLVNRDRIDGRVELLDGAEISLGGSHFRFRTV